MTGSVDRRSVRLVGLDAASQRSKFGYALGQLDPESGRVTVDQAGLLDDADDLIRNQIVPFICAGERALIVIDAPLGWPDGLKQLLHGHDAGMAPPGRLEKHDTFRRHTEKVVRDVKIPLEVAADRIARAAFEALCVLNELRTLSRLQLPSPGARSSRAPHRSRYIQARRWRFGSWRRHRTKHATRHPGAYRLLTAPCVRDSSQRCLARQTGEHCRTPIRT